MADKWVYRRDVFVKSIKNVRNFDVLMNGLALGAGRGRLGLVWGRSGLGKTETVRRWHAHHDSIYWYMRAAGRSSELEFLQGLARELGVVAIAGRKAAVFGACVDALAVNPRPVFLDEPEKMGAFFMDVIKDLTDLTGAPVVLVGEEELVAATQRNRRIWRRIWRQMEFKPVEIADVILLAREAAGVNLSVPLASVLHGGDTGMIADIERDLVNLCDLLNASGADGPTEDMLRQAMRLGAKGRQP
jgi:hypothetical protein